MRSRGPQLALMLLGAFLKAQAPPFSVDTSREDTEASAGKLIIFLQIS